MRSYLTKLQNKYQGITQRKHWSKERRLLLKPYTISCSLLPSLWSNKFKRLLICLSGGLSMGFHTNINLTNVEVRDISATKTYSTRRKIESGRTRN